jgi:hypothetical protein
MSDLGTVHCGCGGLSKHAFGIAREIPSWSCSSCRLVTQSKELVDLRKTCLTEISEKVKSSVKSLSTEVSGIQSAMPTHTSTVNNESASSTLNSTLPTKKTSRSNPARKFNLIFHGIDESPPGTSFNERLEQDFNVVLLVIGSSDNSSSVVLDSIRIGRYRENQKPRPVPVKFNDIKTVHSVLAQKANSHLSSSHSVVIKPDLSKEDRHVNSKLLKERYRLISEENVEKQFIKIRGSQLFVNNRLHGEVRANNFVKSNSLGNLAPSLNELTSDSEETLVNVSVTPKPTSGQSTPSD